MRRSGVRVTQAAPLPRGDDRCRSRCPTWKTPSSWPTSASDGEVTAWIDRVSGEVYWRSDDLGDPETSLPDDIDDNERYVALPDKRELDLGKPLALEFARQFMERDCEDVRDIFSRKGAYRRFRALVERRHLLDQWYAFERDATRVALKAWADENELAIADATT
jgi:uncharacterized protein UPF0158